MKNVLFVCTGNTCRSPMAEALLKNKNSDKKFQVKSAGVFAANGNEASRYAKEVLAEKGIEHDHHSTQLTKELMDWAMYILTMTNSHKEMVINQFPESTQKVFTLKEFVSGVNADIVDPYGGPKEMYQLTLNELDMLLEELVKMEK